MSARAESAFGAADDFQRHCNDLHSVEEQSAWLRCGNNSYMSLTRIQSYGHYKLERKLKFSPVRREKEETGYKAS